MLQTVCPAVPVVAVAGTADRQRNSVPQYLHGHQAGAERKLTDLSLVSMVPVTAPETGESHWPSAMKM